MLYSQTLQKQTLIFFQNGGVRARRAGPGSAFVASSYINLLMLNALFSGLIYIQICSCGG